MLLLIHLKQLTTECPMRNLVRRIWCFRYIFHYFFYHKLIFKVTNTKFDISYCVFRESFLEDQYGIRYFLRKPNKRSLKFIDLGRNHGFIFLYAVSFLVKNKLGWAHIEYLGIDPSPLKFVYPKAQISPSSAGLNIEYELIDSAIVFGQQDSVRLKYGEDNFGNFNIRGSNYESEEKNFRKTDFIEIAVPTIHLDRIKDIIRESSSFDAIVLKIDCKNRTESIFSQCLPLLKESNAHFLIAYEQDGSGGSEVDQFRVSDFRVLRTSRIDNEKSD